MPSLLDRIINIAEAEDEALNAILGGGPRETISGSVGRAYQAGKWWAPFVRTVLDAIFGQGHCLAQAALEAERRS